MIIPFPEPPSDIVAQIAAVGAGKKRAAYISPANMVPELMPGLIAVHRPEGSLVTRDRDIALAFRERDHITEDDMADWLGYPESKDELADNAVVVQARNDAGAVIMECATSHPDETAKEFSAYGQTVILSIGDALRRRMELINGTV